MGPRPRSGRLDEVGADKRDGLEVVQVGYDPALIRER